MFCAKFEKNWPWFWGGGGRKNVKSLQTDRRTDVLTNEQKRTTGDHIYLISVTPQA